MEKDNLLKYLKCPITGLFFRDPVLAEDGQLYEFMAIKEYLSKNNTSPVNPSHRITPLLIRATIIKKMVEEFLENNPEYKSEQFLFRKPYYLFHREFLALLGEKQYDKIKEFSSIVLNTELGKETLFEVICKKCPEDVIKYVIDNSIDYDVYDKRKLKPIHIACKYCSPEIIMHLVSKGVDIESEDINGERPLGYIMLYKKKEEYSGFLERFLEGFLNAIVNVNYVNKVGISPVHLVIGNGDLVSFKKLMEYNLNLNVINQKQGGLNLLQYAFRYSKTDELIKHLVDINLNLDVDLDPNTSCEQLIYQNDNLNKKQKQELVLHYLVKILNKTLAIEPQDSFAQPSLEVEPVVEPIIIQSLTNEPMVVDNFLDSVRKD